VPGMAHRRMSAVGTMLVRVVGMMLLGAGGHGVLSFSFSAGGTGGYCFSAACSMALSTKRRTCVSESE
jgi:hypothetical protein